MNEHELERWWVPTVSRRTLLRGGLLGGAGLAAAALIGCGGDDDDDDTTAGAATGGDSTTTTTQPSSGGDSGADTAGEGMLVQDPDLPYPYQFPEPAGKTPKPGGTLRVAATFNVATMDPTKSAAGGTITVPNMVYNRLLGTVGGPRKDPFKLELEPELAASWERSPDGVVFSFHLRDDVNWQNVEPLNGRPFTAHDAKFAYDLYAADGVHRSYWVNIGSIDAADDHTLNVTMANVTADFILPLASRYQTIFPRELVEDGSIDQRVIGTGPMILDEAEPSSHVTWVKNPDYFESEVLLDGAEFSIQPDYASRLASFRVGQVDYAYQLVGSIAEVNVLLRTNPDVAINLNVVDRSSAPFGMNLSNPIFQDERIRQAITLAIDTKLIEELVFDGLAKSLPLQPWPFLFDKEPTVESGQLGRWMGRHDPAEAKKLLAAAGSEEMSFGSIYYNYGRPTSDHQTEIVVQSLAEVGITMTSRHLDYTEFNSTLVQGNLEEACTSCWTAAGYDADNWFFNQVHSASPGNRHRLNDPQVDAWATQQQLELDPDVRKDIHRTMWDYFVEKMYWPPLPTAFPFEVYQPWLRNIRFGGALSSNSSYYDWGDQVANAWLDK